LEGENGKEKSEDHEEGFKDGSRKSQEKKTPLSASYYI